MGVSEGDISMGISEGDISMGFSERTSLGCF